MDNTKGKSWDKANSLQILAVGEVSKKLCEQPEFKSFAECQITFVATEQDALDLLKGSYFSSILFGFQALAQDDFTVLRKIKALKVLSPIFLVSEGPASADLEVAAYQAGVIDIVAATTPAKLLIAKIKSSLNLQQRPDGDVVDNNEEQLKFALASAKMGMWTVGLPAGNVILSEEACEIFGFAKTYGHSDAAIDEFIHPDFRQQARDVLANAIATNTFYNDEYQIVRPNGEIRWINARGKARYDAHGVPYKLTGLIWDITDRKNAELGLEALELRFLRSTEATDLGVWYCNLPFDTLIWNKEVKGHFFLPPQAQVTIHTFYQIIHPDDREPTRLAIDTSIRTHKPYDTVYRTVDPLDSRNIKYIRAIGWTDYNDAGEPIRFDGITLDVTLQRAKEEELRAAKNAAEKANELKSAFLANMSHEIRTPLGAMIGFADILKDPTISEEERLSYANVITRNGHQLSHIINDILDISKVESGHFAVENVEVEPKAIAEEVISLLGLSAKEKGIAVSLHVKEGTPHHIVTDPLRLRQILMNVIGNAVKFTRLGEVTVTVFSAVKNAVIPEVSFRVEDTGEGIASNDQKKLFQLFSQADNSVTRKFGGTGLGLALSKKLAHALNGDVILERSEKAKGSSFLITVKSGILSAQATDKMIQRQSDLPVPKLDGVKILLVDDTPDNQELISKVLGEHKVIVDVANDGLLGMKKALSGRYDLVLMDLQMPVMDGYTATQRLRERGYDKPIIALSAHAMNEVRLECLNVGCTDYLTKPINFNELLQVVGKYAARLN